MNKKYYIKNIFLSILILILILSLGYGLIKSQKQKNVVSISKLHNDSLNKFVSFYFSKKPDIENRPFLGKESAPLTLIFFGETKSIYSKVFFKNIFPIIKSEYIDTGKLKFYYKYNLDFKDIELFSQKFQYAKTLECVNFLAPKYYWTYYFNSILNNYSYSTDIYDSEKLFNYAIKKQDFYDCLINKTTPNLIKDAYDIQALDLEGITPVIYLGISDTSYTIIKGVPSIQKLKKLIKRKQILLGD